MAKFLPFFTRLGVLIVLTFVLMPGAGWAANDCTCRNRDGKRYQLGDVICLHVDGKDYLAQCEMVANNTAWTRIQSGCPTAQLSFSPASFGDLEMLPAGGRAGPADPVSTHAVRD